MINAKKLGLVICALFMYLFGLSQEFTQTIRGKVIDVDTRQALVGASIVIIDSEPFRGTTTDAEGYFELKEVGIGRVDLRVNFLGYEQIILSNLQLNSAKQLVLTIEMQEAVNKMDVVEVLATKHKAESKNEMATTSTRTLSVDETSRYAGTFNDPARMASNFAGVTANAEGDNSIVVRGNSPKGIKWRLEGVEIPNPNHFADEGNTGGPINALNSAMLANSTFMTGAFAPEYGNAYSGVLDINLRNGNNQKREYAFSAGVLGVDATAEGPFSKKYNGSYLFNYRYSSLAILDNAGIISFGGIPKYQDASFKVLLPTNNLGHFTLFGLWGYSRIEEGMTDTINGEIKDVFQDNYDAFLGTLNLKHNISLGKKAYITSAASLATNGSRYTQQQIQNDRDLMETYKDDLTKKTLRLQSIIDYKVNAKHKLRTGVFYTHDYFNLQSEYWNPNDSAWQNDFGDKGNTGFAEWFATWKFRPTENLSIVSGVHYSRFLLNDDQVLEPRAGLRWQMRPATFFTFGYGRHSRTESLLTHFASEVLADGSKITPNKDLKMLRAEHFVVGIEKRVGEHLNFKFETYYQNLSKLAVDEDPSNPESLINSYDDYTTRQLVNRGTGRNYGIEFTAERYLHKGMYFLATASIYESKYTPLDGIERNTRWNGNYNTNLLLGKEWTWKGNNKNRSLGLNSKVTLLGGNRYTPILLEESIAAGTTVRDVSKLYAVKGDDILQINASFYLRTNRDKTTHEFKIDVQNITNNDAIVNEYYDPRAQEIVYGRQLALIPNIIYTIQF